MATRDIAASGGAAGLTRRSLEAARPRYGEKLIKLLLFLCAALSVAVTMAIVFSLLFGAIDFFREVPVTDFLFGTDWSPSFAEPRFGVLPIVVGTLDIVFWSLLVAVPVGLASSIYLSEYAPARVRRVLKPIIEILGGIPTVAIGLFALGFLRPLAETVFPFLDWRTPHAVGVAGVAVGLLIVPLVASVSDDAMRAVPRSLREGAHALGAGKLKVTLRVVVPAAISGIIASVVLAVSRAVGETMVVLLAAGASPNLTAVPTESVLTMTSFIGRQATGEISTGSIDYYTIFAVGALLFVMTLVMNLLAVRLVRRYREVYE
ncbi:MAG TPA: phosphate ABC transporter permease subunit PstC [Actinomycetota bacterium]|jgi:phosphate transport system permease protein|nr:phosphate ABC transporter permease subunit PstC [Actinomycetota bacterium]